MQSQRRFFVVVLLALFFVYGTAAQDSATILNPTISLSVTEKPLDALAISPRSDFLAVGGRDNLIHLYNLNDPAQSSITLSMHMDRIMVLAFSPDGTLLASGSADRTVMLWDVNAITTGLTASPLHVIAHHTDVVTSIAFTTDANGTLLLATGGRDSTIWLGDALSATPLTVVDQFASPVWALAFSAIDASGNMLLASAAEDGTIWLWGMGETSSLRRLDGHHGPAMSLSFDAAGETLASGGIDGTLRLWDLTTAEIESRIFYGHLAPVTGIAFDDEIVLSASMDGSLRVWDLESDTLLSSTPGSGFPLTALAYHDTVMASIGTEGILNLWQVDNEAAAQIAGRLTRENQITQQNVIPDAPPVEVAAAPTVQLQPAQATRTATNGPTIFIPVANIFSGIKTFPLDGVSWAIDPWETAVGYLQGTAWLDSTGNIALGGHSSYPNGNPGIFAGLYNVNVGDVIIISEGNIERRYVVIDKRTVAFDDVSVVYPTTDNRLTLITCDLPSLDPATGTYLDRLVVIARMVG